METSLYTRLALLLLMPILANSQNVIIKKPVPSSYGIRRGISFSVNGNGYIGLSDVGDSSYFWKYLQADDAWERIANMPGPQLVTYASGFVIGDNIYVVGGAGTTTADNLRSVYQYNTLTGNWSTKNIFPDSGRHSGIGASTGGKGYYGLARLSQITSGFDNSFYEYDPTNDNWKKLKDFPGEQRDGAFAFALDGKIIVGGGRTASFQYLSDLWEYDPASDNWSLLNQLMGTFPVGIAYSTSFSIQGNPYITCGHLGNNIDYSKKIYRYNQSIKDFDESSANELPNAIGRTGVCAFSIGNKGYVVGGWNQTIPLGYKAVYEFTPQAVGLNDIEGFDFEIYPNPSSGKLILSLKNQETNITEIKVVDITGKVQFILSDVYFEHNTIDLDIESLNNGMYFLSMVSGKAKTMQKFFVQK